MFPSNNKKHDGWPGPVAGARIGNFDVPSSHSKTQKCGSSNNNKKNGGSSTSGRTRHHHAVCGKFQKEIVETPNEKDVLIGRGKPFQTHPGNVIFRQIVSANQDKYNNAVRDLRKAVALNLLGRISATGARFLKRCTCDLVTTATATTTTTTTAGDTTNNFVTTTRSTMECASSNTGKNNGDENKNDQEEEDHQEIQWSRAAAYFGAAVSTSTWCTMTENCEEDENKSNISSQVTSFGNKNGHWIVASEDEACEKLCHALRTKPVLSSSKNESLSLLSIAATKRQHQDEYQQHQPSFLLGDHPASTTTTTNIANRRQDGGIAAKEIPRRRNDDKNSNSERHQAQAPLTTENIFLPQRQILTGATTTGPPPPPSAGGGETQRSHLLVETRPRQLSSAGEQEDGSQILMGRMFASLLHPSVSTPSGQRETPERDFEHEARQNVVEILARALGGFPRSSSSRNHVYHQGGGESGRNNADISADVSRNSYRTQEEEIRLRRRNELISPTTLRNNEQDSQGNSLDPLGGISRRNSSQQDELKTTISNLSTLLLMRANQPQEQGLRNKTPLLDASTISNNNQQQREEELRNTILNLSAALQRNNQQAQQAPGKSSSLLEPSVLSRMMNWQHDNPEHTNSDLPSIILRNSTNEQREELRKVVTDMLHEKIVHAIFLLEGGRGGLPSTSPAARLVPGSIQHTRNQPHELLPRLLAPPHQQNDGVFSWLASAEPSVLPHVGSNGQRISSSTLDNTAALSSNSFDILGGNVSPERVAALLDYIANYGRNMPSATNNTL